jgi:hypothetical protein
MAIHTSKSQTPSSADQGNEYISKQYMTSSIANEVNVERARAAWLVIAAALCNALAGQVYYEMSATDPWWLSHAASLTIRAYAVDMANRLNVPKDYGLLLHLSVVALGWAVDRIFVALGVFTRV